MSRQVDEKYSNSLDVMLSESMVMQISDVDTKDSCLNFLAEVVDESALQKELNGSREAGDKSGAA